MIRNSLKLRVEIELFHSKYLPSPTLAQTYFVDWFTADLSRYVVNLSKDDKTEGREPAAHSS